MQLTEWEMYWITRLDNISLVLHLACVGMIIFLFFLAIPAVFHIFDGEALPKSVKVWMKRLIISLISCAIVCSLVPTTKEYAAIKVVPLLVNNEDFQQIGPEFLQLARGWLGELQPTKK